MAPHPPATAPPRRALQWASPTLGAVATGLIGLLFLALAAAMSLLTRDLWSGHDADSSLHSVEVDLAVVGAVGCLLAVDLFGQTVANMWAGHAARAGRRTAGPRRLAIIGLCLVAVVLAATVAALVYRIDAGGVVVALPAVAANLLALWLAVQTYRTCTHSTTPR